jgi:hypothetical protein
MATEDGPDTHSGTAAVGYICWCIAAGLRSACFPFRSACFPFRSACFPFRWLAFRLLSVPHGKPAGGPGGLLVAPVVCWWPRWPAGGPGGLLVAPVVCWWPRWSAGGKNLKIILDICMLLAYIRDTLAYIVVYRAQGGQRR